MLRLVLSYVIAILLILTPNENACAYGFLAEAVKHCFDQHCGKDDSVTISMPAAFHETRGRIHYFGIEVTCKSKAKKWKVLHRYSDFRTLRDVLGLVTDTFVDTPFPGKMPLRGILDLVTDVDVLMGAPAHDIEVRRHALESWLQHVVDHIDSRGPWCEEIKRFLEPNAVTKSRNEVRIALHAGYDVGKDGTHYFGIKVTPKNGRPSWTTYRRYTEFNDLKNSLGAQGDAFDRAPFPAKSWWMDDDMLDARRKALETWLQKVFLHQDSKTVWAQRLRDFLDPKSAQIIA